MKLGWWNKKVKFWSTDLSVATTTSLIGGAVGILVSSTKVLEDFIGLGTYIGLLAVLWGVRSGAGILGEKSNMISVGRLCLLAVPCVLFMVLLIIFR